MSSTTNRKKFDILKEKLLKSLTPMPSCLWRDFDQRIQSTNADIRKKWFPGEYMIIGT